MCAQLFHVGVHTENQAVLLEDVSVRYGSKTVLREVGFSVWKGETVALLGRNGAGKTTLLRAIAGVVRPYGGRILVFGLRAGSVEAKRMVGYLPERPGVYDRLSGLQNMLFHARLNGLEEGLALKRSMELLELFGLAAAASEKVESYSKGMKQRLAVARTLLADPPLLLLDEPTSGLDPEATALLVSLLKEKAAEGTAVLLSTHNPYFARRICGRALIIDGGRIVGSGDLESLVFRRRVRVRLLRPVDRGLLLRLLGQTPIAQDGENPVDEFELQVGGGAEQVADLVERMVQAGLRPVALEPVEAFAGGDGE